MSFKRYHRLGASSPVSVCNLGIMEGILLVLALPALAQVPQRTKRKKKESCMSSLILVFGRFVIYFAGSKALSLAGPRFESRLRNKGTYAAYLELDLHGSDSIG